MDDFGTIAIPVLFLAACIVFIYRRIAAAVRRARKLKRRVVVARVKVEKNGIWVCKFFLYGDHAGFFSHKPSGDRVKAQIVGYDEKNGIYKLEEFKENNELCCM